MTKSYSGLERDKRQEEEVSWTTLELAVYMHFVFVTAISISTSETQGIAYTVSEQQEEKQ